MVEYTKQNGPVWNSRLPWLDSVLKPQSFFEEPAARGQVVSLPANGKLPLGTYLRCRVRYFCDGAMFGSKEFVEGMFRERRGWFGERWKSGARKMRGLAEGELFTVRDLQVDVFG